VPAPTRWLTRAVFFLGSFRSQFKKYCKKRAGRTGVRVRRGSPFDVLALGQCPPCDRGQNRRCIRIPQHCRARQRSPNGINKREQQRAARRAAKAAAKAASQEQEGEEGEEGEDVDDAATWPYGYEPDDDAPPPPPPGHLVAV